MFYISQNSFAMPKLSAFIGQNLVLFLLSYILCPPNSTPPFSYISTNFTSLTLLFTFPKTLQTECSCSASRIGTLCFTILFLKLCHTATVKPVLLFRLPPLLPKVKKGSSLAERKQKVRFDSVSLHSHFTIRFLTAQPLFPPCFLYFPYFLY